MKKRFFVFAIIALTFVALPARDEDVWQISLKKLSSIVTLIEKNYYQDTDHDSLMYSSIRGMIQTLDPHSYFLDPNHFSRLREEHVGKYYGLGILITKQEDRLVVISPIEGGPAYRLGIQAGDIISQIEGESTKPISSYQAMQKLRGPKGTRVTITIARDGMENPFDVTIIREEISLHSVPYSFILKDDIGYIFIRNFSSTTTREFEEKMEALVKQGMKKLILDLRGNGGGTFVQSIELSDEFLPKGATVVSIKGRNKHYNRQFKAMRDNQYEEIPLVILINRGSASAPEILSGAIKDNDRGIIVGEDSWGKGLVQTVFPLAPDLAVALTTAKYFTPSGRSIQRDYTSFEDYMFSRQVVDEEREVRYTSKGRKVLGQGGITPDYLVTFLPKNITSYLISKGAFFTYATRFASKKTSLSKKFLLPDENSGSISGEEKLAPLHLDFTQDNRFLEDFKAYLKEKRIEFDSTQYKEAQEEIKRELTREIISVVWGMQEGIRAYRQKDPVVSKALEVLSEAERLTSDNTP